VAIYVPRLGASGRRGRLNERRNGVRRVWTQRSVEWSPAYLPGDGLLRDLKVWRAAYLPGDGLLRDLKVWRGGQFSQVACAGMRPRAGEVCPAGSLAWRHLPGFCPCVFTWLRRNRSAKRSDFAPPACVPFDARLESLLAKRTVDRLDEPNEPNEILPIAEEGPSMDKGPSAIELLLTGQVLPDACDVSLDLTQFGYDIFRQAVSTRHFPSGGEHVRAGDECAGGAGLCDRTGR